MIIIAESGATKIDWRSVSSTGEVCSVKSLGVNMLAGDSDYMERSLAEVVPSLNPTGESVSNIYFYAAGLVTDGREVPQLAVNLDVVLRKAFPEALIEYASDLLAAARALFGENPGIAVILGTGSNSCEYDGVKIVKNVHPGGFILGDEGGADSLGRLFVSDYIKGIVPEPVASEFGSKFKADYLTLVQQIYRGSAPGRYLGSFAPFILSHYADNEYVKHLVDNNFRSAFERSLSQYDLKGYKLGVVGGFGYAARDILKRIAAEYGVEIFDMMEYPIDGLLRYHCGKQK